MKTEDLILPPRTQREQALLRLSARTFDLQIGVLTVMGIWLCVAQGNAWAPAFLLSSLLWIFPGLVMLLVADAVIHATFGTTPGRCWLKVTVTSQEGKPLSFLQHLKRNGAICFQVLACFFIPVSIFTFPRFYRRLVRGEPAPYDAKAGYRVAMKPISERRLLAFLVTLILTSLILMLFTTISLHILGHYWPSSSSSMN